MEKNAADRVPAVLGAHPPRSLSTPATAETGAPPRFEDPGRDPAAVDRFLRRHRREVENAIRDHYREAGTVWDQKSMAASLDLAERMTRIRRLEMVDAGADGLELAVDYIWEGAGRTELASARFRLVVSPARLTVDRMWR